MSTIERWGCLSRLAGTLPVFSAGARCRSHLGLVDEWPIIMLWRETWGSVSWVQFYRVDCSVMRGAAGAGGQGSPGVWGCISKRQGDYKVVIWEPIVKIE